MRNSWAFLSFLALFSLSVMTLIMTYLLKKGLPTIFVLFIVVLILVVFYGTQLVATKAFPDAISLNYWLLLLIAGIFSVIGNYGLFKALSLAPNPGLVSTIVGLQGGLISILAVWFFKDKVNLTQMLGIALGIIAIVVISLGSRTPKNDSTLTIKAKAMNTAEK